MSACRHRSLVNHFFVGIGSKLAFKIQRTGVDYFDYLAYIPNLLLQKNLLTLLVSLVKIKVLVTMILQTWL